MMNIQIINAAVKKGWCLLILGLMFPLSSAVAEDTSWPMFLHNPSHNAQSSSNLTPPLKILWEFDAGDLIYASPAVADGDYISYRMCDWIDNALALEMAHRGKPIYGYVHLPCEIRVNARLAAAPAAES